MWTFLSVPNSLSESTPLLIFEIGPEKKRGKKEQKKKKEKQHFRCALLLKGRGFWDLDKSGCWPNVTLFWTKTLPELAVV